MSHKINQNWNISLNDINLVIWMLYRFQRLRDTLIWATPFTMTIINWKQLRCKAAHFILISIEILFLFLLTGINSFLFCFEFCWDKLLWFYLKTNPKSFNPTHRVYEPVFQNWFDQNWRVQSVLQSFVLKKRPDPLIIYHFNILRDRFLN